MDRRINNGIAALIVLTMWALMFAPFAHAQDATFTARSEGSITLTKGALDAVRSAVRDEITKGVNVNVKPSGLGGIRQGISDLSDQVGCAQDDVTSAREDINRNHEATTATLARIEQNLDNRTDSVMPWWGWLLAIIILLVALFRNPQPVNVHQTCSCPNDRYSPPTPTPSVTLKDGTVVPIAQIPAIPGTTYHIEPAEPTEIHVISEIRMDEETANGVVDIIEAIGRMPKPEKPADTASEPKA